MAIANLLPVCQSMRYFILAMGFSGMVDLMVKFKFPGSKIQNCGWRLSCVHRNSHNTGAHWWRVQQPEILRKRHNKTANVYVKQESSAKLTNQRVSYAFTSSPLSFHARHILPNSKFQHSYSCIYLFFYRYQWQWTACVRTVSVKL